MSSTTIPVGKHQVEVSPRASKFFRFGFLPLRCVLSFYVTSLAIEAVADFADLSSIWTSVLLFAVFFKRTTTQGEVETSKSMLREPYRTLVGYGLFFLTLQSAFSQDNYWDTTALIVFGGLYVSFKLAEKSLTAQKSSLADKTDLASRVTYANHNVVDVAYAEKGI